ncbi:MAG: hypothetical protein AAB447_01765 [Patescibacteria group bacterium]
MKGTLLKPLETTHEFSTVLGSAHKWFEKYWLVDTNLALDEAWRREPPYDSGREPANITIQELIERGFLDAGEVDQAITEWLNLPWTNDRLTEEGKFYALRMTSVTMVLDTIGRVPTLTSARKALCDRLLILLDWTKTSPLYHDRRDWICWYLLDTVLRLPERNGRYIALYRDRLETVTPGNHNYFSVVFGSGGKWDKVGVMKYLHHLAKLYRRRRQTKIREERKWGQEYVDYTLKYFDEDVEKTLRFFFHLFRYGIYDPRKDYFVFEWNRPNANDEWQDTHERVRRFMAAQNVLAPFRHW